VQEFPTDAITFEAWLSSTDFCNRGTVLSYALDSAAADERAWGTDFNHFVIFDPYNLLVCRGFQYLDLYPVQDRASDVKAEG